MRLIDADKLKTEISECYEYEFPTASGSFDKFATQIVPSIINNAPTVDAVEVVRCKDCKYSTPDIMSEDYRACWERNTVMPNDGFCSYGKRKEVSE